MTPKELCYRIGSETNETGVIMAPGLVRIVTEDGAEHWLRSDDYDEDTVKDLIERLNNPRNR